MRGTDLAKERVTGGRCGSGVESIVVKICEYEEKINAEIDNYVDALNEIRRYIDGIKNSNERLLLRLRYLDFKEWYEIAQTMHYSVRNVHRLHGKALKKLEDGTKCH